jgi:hypothetical protein
MVCGGSGITPMFQVRLDRLPQPPLQGTT